MKTQNLKHLFKAAALTLALSSATVSFAQPSDGIIAVVGNSSILQSEVNQGVAEAVHQLQTQNKDIPPEQYLRRQVLDQLILHNAQLEQVQRYGVQIDENTLNEAVMRVANQSGSKSLGEFQQKMDNIAPGAYEVLRNRVADDLKIQRLRQQLVMSRIKISDQDIENFLKSPEGQAAIGSQAHVLHFRISGTAPEKDLLKIAQATRSELNNSNNIQAIQDKLSTADIRVEGADMGFQALNNIPAELAARVSILQVGQTSELITVQDGVHVLKLLERKSDAQKVIVPQFKTRHILIKTSEVVSPENAKQTIESIYNRIQNGEDFATLAATYSNDPGSARDGGSLGWVTPGMMVPEFDQLMQSTPVNQLTQPFETQFGWHILQVTDKRDKDMTDEQRERTARQVLGERQFDTELDAWLRELRSGTFVEIKDPSLQNNTP